MVFELKKAQIELFVRYDIAICRAKNNSRWKIILSNFQINPLL